jgi:hypothetical protein
MVKVGLYLKSNDIYTTDFGTIFGTTLFPSSFGTKTTKRKKGGERVEYNESMREKVVQKLFKIDCKNIISHFKNIVDLRWLRSISIYQVIHRQGFHVNRPLDHICRHPHPLS